MRATQRVLILPTGFWDCLYGGEAFLEQWDAVEKTASCANLHKPQVSYVSGSLKITARGDIFGSKGRAINALERREREDETLAPRAC